MFDWKKIYLQTEKYELLLTLTREDVEVLNSMYPSLSHEDILNEARHAYEWLTKQSYVVGAVRHFFSKWLARIEGKNKHEFIDEGRWVKYVQNRND